MDHNPQGRRGHPHRGRRGPDRRGPDRRVVAVPDQVNRGDRGDRNDVEQIMREIRARIAQRTGVDLSPQQIQELAARRLEAILDPRGIKPGLLEQLRRTAGERVAVPEAAASKPYTFHESDLYDSPQPLLRFIRKILNPILRLFINPTPVAHTLALQADANTSLATREADRDRRQAEWNALHYEILQRLVTEISRASIEAQNLSLRIESLSAKVDFNERRVRSLEGPQHQRPSRPSETSNQTAATSTEAGPAEPSFEGQPPSDAPRRRRRRRRGRRGPTVGTPTEAGSATAVSGADVETEGEDDFEDEPSAPEAVESRQETSAQDTRPEVPLDHRLPDAPPLQVEHSSSGDPATPAASEPTRDE